MSCAVFDGTESTFTCTGIQHIPRPRQKKQYSSERFQLQSGSLVQDQRRRDGSRSSRRIERGGAVRDSEEKGGGGRHSQHVAGEDVFRKMEMEKSCDQFGRRRQRLNTLTEETASTRRRDDNYTGDVDSFHGNDRHDRENKTLRRGNGTSRTQNRREWVDASDEESTMVDKAKHRDTFFHHRRDKNESTKENTSQRKLGLHRNEKNHDVTGRRTSMSNRLLTHGREGTFTRDVEHNRSRASSLTRHLDVETTNDEKRRKTSTKRRQRDLNTSRNGGEYRSQSLPRKNEENNRWRKTLQNDDSPVRGRKVLASCNDDVSGRDRRINRDSTEFSYKERYRHTKKRETQPKLQPHRHVNADSDSDDSIRALPRINRLTAFHSHRRGKDFDSSNDDFQMSMSYRERRSKHSLKRRDVIYDENTEGRQKNIDHHHDETPDGDNRYRDRERARRLTTDDNSDFRRREHQLSFDSVVDAAKNGKRIDNGDRNVKRALSRKQAVENEKNKLRAMEKKLSGQEEKQNMEESHHFNKEERDEDADKMIAVKDPPAVVVPSSSWQKCDYQNEIVRLQQKMARLQGKVTHLQKRVTHLQSQ